MRIVGGSHRGRKLIAPPGLGTRPTADRVREALFNILIHGAGSPAGAHVLDVFAGTGALGLEALSRGAAHATFIDQDPTALGVVADNAKTLGETDRITLLRADATRPPAAMKPCSLALLDPPYRSGLARTALPALAERGWLTADALAVVEVAADEAFAAPAGFEVTDERRYGAAKLVFIRSRDQARTLHPSSGQMRTDKQRER